MVLKLKNYFDLEDWRIQTYQKIVDLQTGFEPIIERPYAEQYDTATRKKRRKYKKSTKEISEKLHYQKMGTLRREKYHHTLQNSVEKELNTWENLEVHEPKLLMSNGSRRILHNRLKSSLISNLESNKFSKMFNTPVHERLFADHEKRKERIKVLAEEERNKLRFCPSKLDIEVEKSNPKPPIGHSHLKAYRSTENFQGNNSQDVDGKIGDYLHPTFQYNSDEKSVKKLALKSRRSTHLSSMALPNQISDKLYADAQRRQSEKFERIQQKENEEKPKIVQANEVSIKYLMKRFEGDFSAALESQGMGDKYLNYFATCEILKEMGFISCKKGSETNEERILFVDFWRALKGDDNEGVLSQNIKVFLGAIEGFRYEFLDNIDSRQTQEPVMVDRLSVSRGTPSTIRKENGSYSSVNRRKDTEFPIFDFKFDKNGFIQLSKSEMRRIQKKFFLFAMSRSNFLSQENHRRQAEEIAKETEISYKPNIDKKSRKLIKELHEKLNESQIPHYEFLLFKGREYEK